MYTFVTILIIIISILLVLVVLVQNSKGGGLASGFSAPNQIMGVRRTADFLEKFTWGLAIGLIVLSLLANFVLPHNEAQQNTSAIEDQINNAAVPVKKTPANTPAATPTPAAPVKQQGK